MPELLTRATPTKLKFSNNKENQLAGKLFLRAACECDASQRVAVSVRAACTGSFLSVKGLIEDAADYTCCRCIGKRPTLRLGSRALANAL